MKLTKVLYLLSFFAPVAFLLGYMIGAPRPVDRSVFFQKIDTRPMPVEQIDFYRHGASLVVSDANMLESNTALLPAK